MDEKEERLNKNKLIMGIALALVIFGIYLVSRNYWVQKKAIAYENVAFQIMDKSTLNNLDSVSDNDVDEPGGDEESPPDSDNNDKDKDKDKDNKEPKKDSGPRYNYIGTLEIPKINLKKGFVDPSSKYNNIEYNVTILDGLDYPDVKYGNFMLAAHSGSGVKAIFKDLYKLSLGDKAIVTYKNVEYKYKIVKIYTQKKQGYIVVYRDKNKNTLTLVTCTKGNKKLQTVYIAELI